MTHLEFTGGGPWDGESRFVHDDVRAIMLYGTDWVWLRASDPAQPLGAAADFPARYVGHYSRYRAEFVWCVWNLSRMVK